VFDRLAALAYWGWKGGYFDSDSDAQAFFDELRYMLAMQMVAPNSRSGSTPDFTGPMASTGEPGHYYVDYQTAADQVEVLLRAPAAARLLHPGHQ